MYPSQGRTSLAVNKQGEPLRLAVRASIPSQKNTERLDIVLLSSDGSPGL